MSAIIIGSNIIIISSISFENSSIKACKILHCCIEIHNAQSKPRTVMEWKEFLYNFLRILSTLRFSRFAIYAMDHKFVVIWLRCTITYLPTTSTFLDDSRARLSLIYHRYHRALRRSIHENPIPSFPSIDFIDHKRFPSFADTIKYAPKLISLNPPTSCDRSHDRDRRSTARHLQEPETRQPIARTITNPME